MDVSDSQLRRELQIADQRIKDREVDHAREIDTVREDYRNQFENLTAAQKEALKKVKSETDEKLQKTRDRFDEAYADANDSFKKTIQEDRRESYDKYGRMQSENALEKSKDAAIRAKQLNTLSDNTKTEVDATEKRFNQSLDNLRRKFEQDKKSLETGFKHNFEMQDHDNKKTLSQIATDARAKQDATIRRANEEIEKTKTGDSYKYSQLVNAAKNERDSLTSGFELQKRQGDMKNNELQQTGAQAVAKSFEDYAQRSAQNLTKTLGDNAFMVAEKERQAADRISRNERDHSITEQDLRSDLRRAQADLKFGVMAEEDRLQQREAATERRHQQENYLAGNVIRQNEQQTLNDMSAQYTQRAHDLEDDHRNKLQMLEENMKKNMSGQSTRTESERKELAMKHENDVKELKTQYARDKEHLIKQYEEKQGVLDDLKKRELGGLQNYYSEAMRGTHEKADQAVFKNSRDNQTKLYQMQETLRNRTEELETARHADVQLTEDRAQQRLKRLTDAYNRNSMQQKDSFDSTADELRQDNLMRMSKFRGDADHEKKMQLLDLQSKNRLLMTAFENRINQLKDDQAIEASKLKAENEKALRDTLKKTKDTLDSERAIHARELEAKDNLMKEKLKLQEEQFKDSIEKIKRTHELALKKS